MVDPIYIIFNLALDCNALDKKKTQDAYEGDCNDYIVVKKGIYSIVSVISCEFILRFNKFVHFLLMRVHLLSACVTFMNIITMIKIVNSSYSMCYDEGEPELWGYMANGCPWSLM